MSKASTFVMSGMGGGMGGGRGGGMQQGGVVQQGGCQQKTSAGTMNPSPQLSPAPSPVAATLQPRPRRAATLQVQSYKGERW